MSWKGKKGFKTLKEGELVTFIPDQGQKGMQAVAVVSQEESDI